MGFYIETIDALLNMKKTLIVFLVAILIVLCFYTGWLGFEKRTQDTVLAIIASAQPGRTISEVIDQFGEPIFQTDDVKRMKNGGAPVNPTFCDGKTLYQYYVSPPCTWVNIYTDENGIIVYVNWSRS